MKKIVLGMIGLSTMAFGQVSDSVSLGAGYANESYYSFENGEVSNVDNYDWDLSFDLSPFGASVRMNRKNTTLWVYPGVDSDWSTLDTTGMSASWDQEINGYEFWHQGALNMAADQSNPSDLGWGLYNSITHDVEGFRIFVFKLASGDYKKFYIEILSGGAYVFKYANLNNSNEVTETLTKSNYPDKNFVYYDLGSSSIIDREPTVNTWDVVFTNFVLELAPGYFGGVTGVLQNNGVTVSEVSGVPTATSTFDVFHDTINTIGHDWKTFNMITFNYDIVDDLSYFIQNSNGDVWKLVFTDFEGGTTGKIHFSKEQVEFASVPAFEGANLSVYPNPANDILTVSTTQDIKNISMMNVSGQVVKTIQSFGVTTKQISTSELKNGIYFVKVVDSLNRTSTQKIVVQH